MDKNDQAGTKSKRKRFQQNKILRCKRQVKSQAVSKRILEGRKCSILNQIMNTDQCCMEQGNSIGLRKKNQRDNECNFLDQINCNGHQNMELD